MATPEELQDRMNEADQEEEGAQGKRERIQEAIDAREHANEYQNDSEEANTAADEAESRIDNPEG